MSRTLLRIFVLMTLCCVPLLLVGCGGGTDAVAVNDEGGGEHGQDSGGGEHNEDSGGGEHNEDSGGGEHNEDSSGGEHDEDSGSGEHNEDSSGGEHDEDSGSGEHDEDSGSGEHDEDSGSGEHDEDSGSGEHDQDSGSGEHDQDSGSGEHDQDSGSGEHDEDSGSGEHDEDSGSGEHDQDSGSGEHDQDSGSGEHDQDSGSGEHDEDAGSGEHDEDAGSGEHDQDSGSGEHDQDSGDSEDGMYSGDYDTEGGGSSGDTDGEDYGSEERKPKTYLDMALVALRRGQMKETHQYMAAHAVSADLEATKALLDTMGWVTPLNRPQMTVRWGVGIVGHAPPTFSGNCYPVGTIQNIPQPRGLGGGDAGGFGGGGNEGGYGGGEGGYDQDSGAGINALLSQFTGELGQKLIEGFRERLARGDYGPVVADASGGDQNSGGDQGYSDDGGGYGSSDEYGGTENGGQGNGQGVVNSPPVPLLPGVVLVGVDLSSKPLIAKSKTAEVDVLCVFDITVAPTRTGLINNTTKIEVYNVATGRKDFTTKDLKNVEIQKARAEGDAVKDNVDRELGKLFEYMDSTWKMVNPLPAESVPVRMQAIGEMFNDPPQNPLPVMAELKMYYMRGNLQGANLLSAFQRLVGEQTAQVLASGTEEEKRAAIDQWLPEAGRQSKAPDAAGAGDP